MKLKTTTRKKNKTTQYCKKKKDKYIPITGEKTDKSNFICTNWRNIETKEIKCWKFKK